MNNKTYLSIMADTMVKKEKVLEQLMEQTKLQEKNLTNNPADMEAFEKAFLAKDTLIDQLNQLDNGFEKLFEHVKVELRDKKDDLKNQIKELQQLITNVVQKSTELQALEQKNKSRFDMYIHNNKDNIKSYNHSSKTVSNYYKNMVSQYQGQSYFLDKKK